MAIYELLAWDSEILELSVARLLPARLTADLLQAALAELRALKVKLVYWCSDRNDVTSQTAAEACHGQLVDEKATYLYQVHSLPENFFNDLSYEFYHDDKPNAELIELALASGQYSRFVADKHLPKTKFEKLYTQWMINSCNKSIAQGVIVIKDQLEIAAMATVGIKQGRGDIGLLAVREKFRGKGYGVAITRAAQDYFTKQGKTEVQVVTQYSNTPACRLYEKCNFKLEQIQKFYHFWLG